MLFSRRKNKQKNIPYITSSLPSFDEGGLLTERRIIIVSNRLPVKVVINKSGQFQLQPSEGGLATGLSSVYKRNDNLWIGWPGAFLDERQRAQVQPLLEAEKLLPVYLTEEEIAAYYEGFSNETLWPLYHYFPSYTLYKKDDWEMYCAVNRKFAEHVLRVAREEDIIWVHDYQLCLVPELIRQQLPNVTIGFFQHIPFPDFEIFRLLPWRKEILKGLLGADLIGFHTLDDTKHFIASCSRLLNLEVMMNRIVVEGREVMVDTFPMGIDFEKFQQWARKERTLQNERRLRSLVGSLKIMISVDRLDYSKGILNRLEAFEQLLDRYPHMRGKISFIQLVVPSRDQVPQYRWLKDEIDKKVSSINSRFSSFGWTPIYYFYRSFQMDMLSALYKTADIAMITPMRDGMNLVSKEYIASKIDPRGVLILSEMAGASKELLHAIIVNPNDIEAMVDALLQAIEMPEEEQVYRIRAMQEIIAKYNVYHWVNLFIETLEEVKQQQDKLTTKMLNRQVTEHMIRHYAQARKRILLLDYDGTLVPYFSDINQAIPDRELKRLLLALARDTRNRVVVISGRTHETLSKWLGDLPVDLIAEHGVWRKDHGQDWQKFTDLSTAWKPSIRHILEMYMHRTPGSFIEEKSYSLAWHYRNVSAELGEERARELIDNLKFFSSHHGLQVLSGNKVIEIKNAEVNKGKAARALLKEQRYDFILAIGDDATDEDTFRAMPSRAYTIRVGSTLSLAQYYLRSYQEVRALLNNFAEANVEELIKK
ncbi:bifunctional alpha,alpha-trehalose-phosphate synthase (UDP-forming)/trehalose-phosphatase [Thermoflavifilum thermophilum]|uniref:Alpha,alpha-trehalose-phosphate synthase n=1 Tax=Thermoflavifilum thermophilum TaxID=1393122 RepID=A0A1I7NGP8_9BACT|nr:bifunctional alpha,alpha-trehalose-phosphate synthase (UDP-forming)/trehalose-phosphatase [Thermoflavifilum thermophilum]SFV33839.1 trehalose 6-phosphate synthase [Thermoflavifilum thermophilum]